ncbi:CshA/CshB family fibrillar adhesin-related protein [Cellulomonas palmilytica]|uniref:CshA/CshB family fibrillar adhesin-related protein n=1 Tax=Cellulomonas palmilytica TaxID=2608402 RepID=UPI001F483BB0|nr:CshA/CshB family fibrillar adhesin-related protein [Cellulomonas palmilytica]UJP39807.1 hypothetical protein F1D97_16195 [Cellulomonas palmilytica]
MSSRLMRAAWTAVAVLVVAAAGVAVQPAAPARSAVGDASSSSGSGAPVRATTGSGLYRDRILWVNWGAQGASLNATSTTVWTYLQVGDLTRLEVQCTLSGRSGDSLQAYRSGQWGADGLQVLYNTPANDLVNGIGTVNQGVAATFNVGCGTARLATYASSAFTGAPTSTAAVTLSGLVFADAESTNGGEFTRATPTPSTATWRILDVYPGTCSATYRVQRDNANRLTLGSSAECSAPGRSATAVAFADGATTLAVSLEGSGLAAAAFGVVVGVDYGDAPASYGLGGGVVQPTWSGGSPPVNSIFNTWTTLASNGSVSFTRAVLGPPATRLGPNAVPELLPASSADASGDTPDEDALAAALADITYVRGVTTTYAVANIRCAADGATTYVRGWLDWNRNGQFDAGEASSADATCTSTTSTNVTLSFAVPSAVPEGQAAGGDRTFLRLMASTVQAQLAPTGFTARGEVEDWPVRLRVPRLQVTKTANATVMPAAGGVVTYTVVATNVGNGSYTAATPARVYDDLTAVTDDATRGTVTSSPTGVTVSGQLVSWSGALDPGASVTLTIPVTVLATPGDRVMTNVARVSHTVLAAGSVTCAAGSSDEAAQLCARHVLYRSEVRVTKEAFTSAAFTTPITSGASLAPGTTVYWRYTVQNTGSAPLTDVVLTDTATDTRTDAGGTTSATTSPVISCPGTPTVTPGTSVTISSLAAGASRVCTATAPVGVL